MKNIKILLVLLTLVGLWSCEKDEIRAELNPNAAVEASLSAPSVVLSKDEAENNVLTVSWKAPEFGYQAAPSYMVLIDKDGGNFSEGYSASVGTALEKTFKGAELNTIIKNLGLTPSEIHKLNVVVRAVLSNQFNIQSPIVSLNASGYESVLDLSSPWGIVGSATPNEWNGPDVPFYKTSQNNVFVAYTTLKEGEIKFRKNNDWAENLGDTGADGSLEAGGDNIKVTAGTYKITMNLTTNSYNVEKYTMALVGSATPNGWDAPDALNLTYDPFSDQFRAIVTLKEGEFKFRINSSWDQNFGGSDGNLVAGGDNIKVTAGTYLVSLNLGEKTYSVQKLSYAWGLVGSATPNEWNGPDVVLNPDYSRFSTDFETNGIWIAKNITLKDGEIKFRANNDWAHNYGDAGTSGTLKDGGDNIKVTAGKYDIELDLSKKTYTLTKK